MESTMPSHAYGNTVTNESQSQQATAQILKAANNLLNGSCGVVGGNATMRNPDGDVLAAGHNVNQSLPPQYNRTSDLGKRKKSKSKAANTPTVLLPTKHGIHRDLDEWLDNCLKDGTSGPLTSSSSEFLDNNFPNHSHLQRNIMQSSMPFTMKPGVPGAGGTSPATGIPDSFYFQKLYPSFQYGQPSGYNNVGSGMPMANQMHNRFQNFNNMSSDFASLPPAVNMNLNKDLRIDAQDIADGLEPRRFSDPCLAANSDSDSKDSGNGPNQNSSSSPNKTDSNSKMLSAILEQISVLHDTNTKICRNLHENKVDIEALKHAPNWGLRHRRDSISGLSTHSQPMGYAFGTHSPAPTFHSGMYTPGMLTDVVREVKEAARVREEALLSRVRAMVEERSWSINDTNLKMIRDLEEMKIQIAQLRAERKETSSHISKMEDEIKSLRDLLSHVLNNTSFNRSNQSSFNDREFVRSSPQAHRQNRQSLNLNYGTINNDETLSFANENDIVRPMNQQFNDIRKAEKLKYSQNNGKPPYVMVSNNANQQSGNNGSSSQARGGFSGNGSDVSQYSNHNELEHGDGHIVQREKDTLELRRELQDALDSRKHAESKILALEHMVKKLQNAIPHNESSTSDATAINYYNQGATNNSRKSSLSDGHPPATSSPLLVKQQSQLHSSPGVSQPSSSPSQPHNMQTVSPKLLANSGISLTGPVTDL